MSNAQHTPGPWKTADYIVWPANGGNAQFPVHAPKRGRIALALNREADARLIAAAPEFLSALLCALDDLEAALPTLRAAGWQTHNEEATIRRGRAAIAKATGELA